MLGYHVSQIFEVPGGSPYLTEHLVLVFFVSMFSHVTVKACCEATCVITLIACVWLLSTVFSHVIFQSCCT